MDCLVRRVEWGEAGIWEVVEIGRSEFRMANEIVWDREGRRDTWEDVGTCSEERAGPEGSNALG